MVNEQPQNPFLLLFTINKTYHNQVKTSLLETNNNWSTQYFYLHHLVELPALFYREPILLSIQNIQKRRYMIFNIITFFSCIYSDIRIGSCGLNLGGSS